MAKKKVAEAETPVDTVVVVGSDKDSVVVTWDGGSRVYNKTMHGADYKKLAAEFAAKRGGTIA